ncbi:hypothetical protein EZV62_026239 [Acer yangbiense]|uniref:Uncharacterized protein n=1 Tax=Acer yangbiense TaxID=1000413 RepID=A0A5C7GQX2_9ROSI|nr:hypothetical protein EZV62_026239 [Acer yangbiense]
MESIITSLSMLVHDSASAVLFSKRSAINSDVVWYCFLGPEYLSTISSLSKEGLYHLLTGHNLIHNGRLSFWFDLSSGKKCYMISSKELYMVGYDRHPLLVVVFFPTCYSNVHFLLIKKKVS